MQARKDLISIIIKFISWTIGIIVLIPVLFLCGCWSLVAVVSVSGAINESVQEQRAERDFEQALEADLPDNVEILVSEQSPFLSVLQNKSGRYALTNQGFYNFTTGEHTSLPICDLAIYWAYWISDELFSWKGCVFEAEILKPSVIERHLCYDCSLEEARVKVRQVSPQIDEIFYPSGYEGDIYFVHYIPDGAPKIHKIYFPQDIGKQIVLEANVPSTEIPRYLHHQLYEGRRIQENTERLSPDGQLKAFFDGHTLTVKRITGDTIVAQVSEHEFYKVEGTWFNKAQKRKRMVVDGWTDDSKQVLISVHVSYIYLGTGVYQTFVLNIP